MEFKVGDRVKIKSKSLGDSWKSWKEWRSQDFPDNIGFIKEIIDEDNYECIVVNGDFFLSQDLIKITNNKTTIMNKLTSMLKRLLDKDAQTLYKVGFINGDLELTEEGKKELNGIVFDIYKVELVKKAEEIIAEEKEEKK